MFEGAVILSNAEKLGRRARTRTTWSKSGPLVTWPRTTNDGIRDYQIGIMVLDESFDMFIDEPVADQKRLLTPLEESWRDDLTPMIPGSRAWWSGDLFGLDGRIPTERGLTEHAEIQPQARRLPRRSARLVFCSCCDRERRSVAFGGQVGPSCARRDRTA